MDRIVRNLRQKMRVGDKDLKRVWLLARRIILIEPLAAVASCNHPVIIVIVVIVIVGKIRNF